MYTTMEQIFERIRDAYSDPNDLLETIGVSYGELLSLLYEQNLLTKETLPFIFNSEGDAEGDERNDTYV